MKATHIIKELFTGNIFKVYKLSNINVNIWRTEQGRFFEEREIEIVESIKDRRRY